MSSMLPPGTTGRRPSTMHGDVGALGRRPSSQPGAVPHDSSTTNTKRTTAVGDPIPQTTPLPAPGDPIASPNRSAVGTAISNSQEHLMAKTSSKQSNMNLMLDENFFYDKLAFKPSDVSAKQMDAASLSLFYSFGFESHRRNNLHYLNEHTVATVVGNVLVFLNLRTLDQDYMPGLRDGAIGSIVVHPSRRYIAVAEISYESPNIYIFEYPSLQLYRVLRQGAERGFSDICFNNQGDKLASVGMDPDYMLTIWDWKQEKIVLRSKAFSQDVYSVAFSPDTDGQLTTSGMGHIKFWRMASTFTGLKLQGYIGKFGLTELTDIATFVQLPDGKVLSSTETGNLLLWDGGMIKCEIAGKGKKPCHQGRVEVILLVEGEIFTAGEDGYIRVWDFETIDTADVVSAPSGSQASAGTPESGAAAGVAAGQARVFEMEPIDEILIGKDVKIKTMIKSMGATTEYLVQDQLGHLFKVDTQKRSAEKIMSFHSGGIVGVDTSPLGHSMVSLGTDGTLRGYDYITKTLAGMTKYPSGGTAMAYLPETLDARGCTLAAGFSDGVLRIISHTPLNAGGGNIAFDLQYVFKPHNGPISSIGISADGTWLATTSTDKTVFFFKINAEMPPMVNEEQPPVIFSPTFVEIIPIGFLPVETAPTKLSFSPDNHLNIDEIEPVEDDGFNDHEIKGDGDVRDEEIEGKRAFMILETGELLSMIVPLPEAVDNSLTFELKSEQLQIKRWTLSVPAAAPTPAATAAAKEAQANGGTDADQDTSAETKRVETPEEPQNISGRLTSAARKQHGLVIEDESPITNVMYLEGGYFLIALQNKYREYEIRACKYGTPKQSRLVLVYKAPFTDMRLSTSGKYLLAGATDGMTCIRKFRLEDILLYRWTGGHEVYAQYSQAFDEEEASAAARRATEQAAIVEEPDSTDDLSRNVDVPGQYWFGHAHNSKNGRITSVAATFDDAFFATTGADGGLFVWRVSMEDIKSSEAYEGSELIEIDQGNMVDDIVDSNAYSLQEAKVKSEKDKEIEDAENKKQVTRDDIQELRNEFLKLVTENEKAPPEQQIARTAVTIDPDLQADIERESEEKIRLVRKELEWISEKESIIPNKLRKTFLDVLQTERIEIRAFKANHIVATFRTTKLEQSVEVALQPLTNGEGRTSRTVGYAREHSAGQAHRGDMPETVSHESMNPSKKAEKPADAKSKLEARKQLRAERASMWKELMDAKPDESYEDPRDVAAIRYAEQHMGDYKLKTGEKYIVPESERVDADKKRRQILLLKESVFSLKEQFNQKVLSLRDCKKFLVEQVDIQNRQLEEINAELVTLGVTVEDKLWTPAMEASAYPENRYKVTAADIAQFQKEDAQAVNAARGNQDDLMGGFGSSAVQSKEAPPTGAATMAKSRPTTQQHPPLSRGASAIGMGLPPDSRPVSEAPALIRTASDAETAQQKSPLEIREQEIKQKELIYKKKKIVSAIDQAIKSFDTSLDRLVKEKVVLEGDLKSADMKLLLLYREWVLLKEFEKHDRHLADKLTQKRNEKDEIDGKIKECQEKLNAKKSEIEQFIKKEKEVQEEFRKTLGENNRYEEFLTRVFRKKIKRSKKKTKPEGTAPKGEGPNEDEDEVEEEEDMDEDEDDMDDYDDEESVTSETDLEGGEECPPDYDRASFARVLELREERLDQEDILAEIQKAVEVLKKENDALIKKEKIIDMALRTTESEIQEFQTQKQQKLNELDVVVPLRLHQMQYLERNTLPTDLSPALVFVNEGLSKLRNRIKELQQEKADIRKQHKELKKMHVSLIKSRKEKQLKLQELEARATDVQMLKFGHIIDLEKLERMGVNKGADELREKLAKEDAKRLKEVEELEVQLNRLKEEITDVTRENTVRLESLVDLTDARQKLEEQLNTSQLSATAEYSGPQRKDVQEREKLVTLVHTQAQEIEDLKREIELLIRKPMRHLPPVLRSRLQTQSQGPPVQTGGMATGEGIVFGAFDAQSVPNAAEAISQE
ncbi:hypothetical protein SpCBS45565_g01378 [Spizellomyces sp. 'palustris']|nr:hypothetical protein SpCBS45565_g01378 [Spizellomyces sp. 'palustris']